MKEARSDTVDRNVRSQRFRLLRRVHRLTEGPMVVLSIVWLVILVVDFLWGLKAGWVAVSLVIWGIFILDFLLKLVIAPRKTEYLKENWITAASLALPALRMLRIVRIIRFLRVLRAVRALNLLRFLTALNRGLQAVGRVLAERGVGYVVLVTMILIVAGAAAMLQFEQPQALREAGKQPPSPTDPGIFDYGDALFWTAMTMTTMGSDYFPKTTEGRILGWLLAVYAFSIFGYITASVASYFIGRKTQAAREVSPAGSGAASGVPEKERQALREELEALRREVYDLRRALEERRSAP